MALYIPRTSDLNQLARLVPEGETVEAIHYCVTRKSKVCTSSPVYIYINVKKLLTGITGDNGVFWGVGMEGRILNGSDWSGLYICVVCGGKEDTGLCIEGFW